MYCTHVLYTGIVHSYCTQVLYTCIVHSYCTHVLYTCIVHSYCTQVLYTNVDLKLRKPMRYRTGAKCVYNGHVFHESLVNISIQ